MPDIFFDLTFFARDNNFSLEFVTSINLKATKLVPVTRVKNSIFSHLVVGCADYC